MLTIILMSCVRCWKFIFCLSILFWFWNHFLTDFFFFMLIFFCCSNFFNLIVYDFLGFYMRFSGLRFRIFFSISELRKLVLCFVSFFNFIKICAKFTNKLQTWKETFKIKSLSLKTKLKLYILSISGKNLNFKTLQNFLNYLFHKLLF